MSSYPEGVQAFCKKYGIANNECWSAHGTWVVKHCAIERVAQANGIKFDPPVIVEANSERKIAVVQVTGHMEGVPSEWSFGEAAPANNKNAYPFAMAEKRAKDRVALKLLGGHGILFSQDEIDEHADNEAAPTPAPTPQPQTTGTGQRKPDGHNLPPEEMDHLQEYVSLVALIKNQKTTANLEALGATDRFKTFCEVAPKSGDYLRGEYQAQKKALTHAALSRAA